MIKVLFKKKLKLKHNIFPNNNSGSGAGQVAGTPLPNKSKILRADQITSKKEKLFFKGLRHNCVRSYCHYEGSET